MTATTDGLREALSELLVPGAHAFGRIRSAVSIYVVAINCYFSLFLIFVPALQYQII